MVTAVQQWKGFTPHPQAKAIIEGLNDIPENWALTTVSNKRPYRDNWQKETPLTKEQIKESILNGEQLWSEDKEKYYRAFPSGYGLRLGDVSGGLMALDIDGASVQQLLNAIADGELPPTVMWTSGKEGHYQLLFQVPDKYRERLKDFGCQHFSTWNGYHCKEGEHLELRYNGVQSVLPCSYHPETGRYEWLMHPKETPIAIAPDWIIKLALGELTNPAQQQVTPQLPKPPKKGSKNRWEKYLDTFEYRSEPIPLINCLSRENRELAESGVGEGSRDNTAIRIALDAVGCEQWLKANGQAYDGSAEEIVREFCSRCSPPLSEKDINRIYQSAQKRSQGSAIVNQLGDDAMRGVVASHFWEQEKANYRNQARSPSASSGATSRQSQQQEQEDTKSKAEQIRELVNDYISATNEIDKAIAKSTLWQRFKISNQQFEKIIAEVAGYSGTEKPKAKRISAKDFFSQEVTGIKWLIPGLLPASGVTVLGGDAGTGKTTLAYDCAASLIYSDQFLGESPTTQGTVLFVSSDEPINFAQDKMINRGILENFEFLDQWDVSQWELLEQTIADVNPSLVIMDSFSGIHNDEMFDENSPQAKATIYRLNRILSDYNAGCILIHHLSKSKENKGVNKLRGSSAIAAASSMVWLLEGENEVKSFSQPKTRGTEPLNLKVKLDAESGVFSVVEGQVYDDETKKLGDRIVALFESLEPGKRLEIKEISEYIPVNRDSLYKALNRLTKRGILIKRPSTVNKRSKVWGLPTLDSEEKSEKHSPTPQSDRNCPKNDETTANSEYQTLDKHWTDIGHIGQTLDTNNCPNSKNDSQQETQTLDRQPWTEGGVSLNNNCPISEADDSASNNQRDVVPPFTESDRAPDIQAGDTIKYRRWTGEIATSEVKQINQSSKNGSLWITHKNGSLPSDSDDLLEVMDQWGNIKWSKKE